MIPEPASRKAPSRTNSMIAKETDSSKSSVFAFAPRGKVLFLAR